MKRLEFIYLKINVISRARYDVDNPLSYTDYMEDDQHGGNDTAGNLTTWLPLTLMHHLPAVSHTPAQQQPQRDQVEDDHLEGGNPYQSCLVMSQCWTDVQVQEENDDRVHKWGEDGHPGEDVEEDTNEAGQPGHHHHPGVESQGMEQVLKVDVNLPGCLTVNCATCQCIDPVNIYVSSVPGKNLRITIYVKRS